MKMEEEANAQRQQVYQAARARSLTLEGALVEMSDAAVGIPADLYGSPDRSLAGLVLKNNRLRGLGLLLAAFAVACLLVDTVLPN